MTDVKTTIKSGEPIRNGHALTGVTKTGQFDRLSPDFEGPPVLVSGVAGAAQNGYLDTRFDKYDRYTS